MPLPADTLLDRLQLKRQITVWRGLAILLAVAALFVLAEQGGGHGKSASPVGQDYIARFSIEGMILDDPKRDELLAEIKDNPRIKALIVRLDTPGGSAVAGQELYEGLRAVAAGKPVIAVMRDMSASAGYLTAIGADRIFAREGTLTGSIGVIIQAAEFSELAEKIGINPITIKTGALKDALSPAHKPTPEAIRAMQEVIDDFFAVFVDMVAERRKLPRDEVLKLADGRVFTGRQALARKLIDQLGGEEEAVAWMESQKLVRAGLEVREVEVKKDRFPGFLEQLVSSVTQKILPAHATGLDGLVAIWHPNLQLQ